MNVTRESTCFLRLTSCSLYRVQGGLTYLLKLRSCYYRFDELAVCIIWNAIGVVTFSTLMSSSSWCKLSW